MDKIDSQMKSDNEIRDGVVSGNVGERKRMKKVKKEERKTRRLVIDFTSQFHEFRTQEHCALIFYRCNLLLLLIGEFGVSDGGAVVHLWE